MLDQSSLVSWNHITKHNHYVLLIDDSGPTRSILARHIMLSCTLRKRSCAIYRLGERSDPTLTYYENPKGDKHNVNEEFCFDLAVYEASSPRHALLWLKQSRVDHLTIISDVIMPNDTEVGLPGLLRGLNELQIRVNLLFVSSEAQSKQYIQKLLNGHNIYFVIKGSDVWARLPDALVNGVDHFKYTMIQAPKLEPYRVASIPPNLLVSPSSFVSQPVPPPRETHTLPPQEKKHQGFWSRFMSKLGF